MLTRLQLINFQPHTDLRVRLDPRVTTIVGPSDAGKSAIARALRWLCTNRPVGDGFISWGAPGVTVKVWVDDHTIARRRGPGTNIYELDGARLQLERDRNVPAPITALLGVDDVNFQMQHEPHYWLGLQPAEVARQLNDIVDLGVIDTCLSSLAATVRTAKAAATAADDRLAAAKTAHARLTYVTALDNDLTALEAQAVAATNARTTANRVGSVVAAALSQADNAKRAAAVAQAASCVVASAGVAQDARRRATRLRAVLTALDAARDVQPPPSLDGLTAAMRAAADARRRADRLRGLVAAAQEQATKADTYAANAVSTRKQLRGALCPTCKRPLPQS